MSDLDQQFHTSRQRFTRVFDEQARPLAMRARSLPEFQQWEQAARRKLRELLGVDRLESSPPNARRTGLIDCGDYVREHWLIDTEPDVTMPMFVLRPKQARERPAVMICPHGHGSGGKVATTGATEDPATLKAIAEFNNTYGVEFVRAGFVTFCPDARGFGARREPEVQRQPLASSCHHLQMMATPLGVTVAGMWVFDLMRLIDHIQTRPELDGRRIGVAGLSGGGLQTLYLSALDQRVRAAVISGYFYGARQSLLEMPGNCPCNMIPHLWEYMDMGDVGALIAPRPLVIETGDRDPLNGLAGLDNVLPQVAVTRRAYELHGTADRLLHHVFQGPHRWDGTSAVPAMQRALVG